MSKGKVVTGFDFDVGIVTIDVPHGETLTALCTALGRWNDQVRHLDASMAVLRGGPGVFLGPDGEAVVPGWWERKANGRHVAWYLVWSHAHTRRTGCKRRQYVKAAEVGETRVKVQRTREYRDLAARREKLQAQIDQVGQALARITERYGMETKTTRRGDDSVTTPSDGRMETKPADQVARLGTTGGQEPGVGGP